MWISYLYVGIALISADVVRLGSEMDKLVQSGRPMLVQFYAPWCGHCQQLAPTWKKVGEKIGHQLTVGKLDCTEHQSLAQRYGIRGFPTIKFFRNGRAIDFEGSRSEKDILNFVNRASGPAVKEPKKTLAALVKSNPEPPIFIYIGEKNEQYEKFETVAESYVPNLNFYYIPAFHAPKIGVIKDKKMIDFPISGPVELDQWVHTEKDSSFGEFSLKLAKKLVKRKYIVIAVDKVDGSDKTKVVEEVALSRNSRYADFFFTHAFTDMAKRSINHLTYRDASDGDVIILPQSDHDGHYYLLKEPENELELLDFMQAIKDGKAERHGTSAIGRFISDFLNGFIRLFKENPILGSLIVGIPVLLVCFIIWGICSIPEGEYEDYDSSGTDGDISANEDEPENIPEFSPKPNLPGLRKRPTDLDATDSSSSEEDENETSKDK